jgi:hypothetical protein
MRETERKENVDFSHIRIPAIRIFTFLSGAQSKITAHCPVYQSTRSLATCLERTGESQPQSRKRSI